jgi:hypothetical protein
LEMLKLIEKSAPDTAFDPETIGVVADAYDVAARSPETREPPAATGREA